MIVKRVNWAVSTLFLLMILLVFFLILIVTRTMVLPESKPTTKDLTRDWNDDNATKMALSRTGLGELAPIINFDEYRKLLYMEYGFDALLSDLISYNRSVPDARPLECRNVKYLADLPQASIIIVVYNERLSVLLRTVHSILNRTPDELIREIILVDDGSTYKELHDPLNEYFAQHFPKDRSKVRLLRLKKRHGLMVSRMMGARAASKDSSVLVFFDAHFEVNYNWLPPLLEPIALNPRTCTVPVIDRIFFGDFHYVIGGPFRGYFDWGLNYAMRGVHKHELQDPTKNFPEYVILGCAMAIGAKFFFEIGGFDEGMILWGGEQFEISFKVWMCGGKLLGVPCSHVAHLFRDVDSRGNTNLYGNYNYTNINYRRLVDVWFDEEHREIVYKKRPALNTVNPGNLTDRIALRDRLHCKSFTWMMENVMSDLKKVYPPVEPDDFGNGTLQSREHPNFCLALDEKRGVILDDCKNKTNSSDTPRFWHYTWRCEIKDHKNKCLDFDGTHLITFGCHKSGGNQQWYYDPLNEWIVKIGQDMCLVANVQEGRVELARCEPKNVNIKWIITYVNGTAGRQCAHSQE